MSPLLPSTPFIPAIPWVPWIPVNPWSPSSPFWPAIPVIPCIPCAPMSPFCPLSPLSPVVTKETNMSSLFINGLAVENASFIISKVHQFVLLVKSDTANNKNSLESAALDILTWPLTADVTASIDVKKVSILLELSSVESMYNSIDEFWVVLSNLNLPVPGSASTVDVSKV